MVLLYSDPHARTSPYFYRLSTSTYPSSSSAQWRSPATDSDLTTQHTSSRSARRRKSASRRRQRRSARRRGRGSARSFEPLESCSACGQLQKLFCSICMKCILSSFHLCHFLFESVYDGSFWGCYTHVMFYSQKVSLVSRRVLSLRSLMH